MKKRTCVIEMCLLMVIALLLSFGTALEIEQQNISDSLIRLHVTADSDSPEDQAIKLAVRDAILGYAQTILSDCTGRSEAGFLLEENLLNMESVANEALHAAGSEDRAKVYFQRELFGTRYYDTFALPGGYYDTLRVSIGSGEGKNWWCVVYPGICVSSVSEPEIAMAVMGSEDTEELLILPGEDGEYSFRFKTLELFENLMGWIRSHGDGIPTSR